MTTYTPSAVIKKLKVTIIPSFSQQHQLWSIGTLRITNTTSESSNLVNEVQLIAEDGETPQHNLVLCFPFVQTNDFKKSPLLLRDMDAFDVQNPQKDRIYVFVFLNKWYLDFTSQQLEAVKAKLGIDLTIKQGEACPLVVLHHKQSNVSVQGLYSSAMYLEGPNFSNLSPTALTRAMTRKVPLPTTQSQQPQINETLQAQETKINILTAKIQALEANQQISSISAKHFFILSKPGSESGTSTSWANLPTPLKLQFTTTSPNQTVIVHASISRVQHHSNNVNTSLAIIIDNTLIAETNTGGSSGWSYRPINFFGVTTVASAGTHYAEVQYKTQSGTVYFSDDINGRQCRTLLVTAN